MERHKQADKKELTKPITIVKKNDSRLIIIQTKTPIIISIQKEVPNKFKLNITGNITSNGNYSKQ
jgi:hypothetical protein